MIGQVISHYKVTEKLGEGGMGIVYKAHDTELERDVALKFLPNYLTSDPAEKDRFFHEARAASALNHPNVTTIYEIREYNNQLYIAMEFVEGRSLKTIVTAGHDQPLPLSKILDIGIQVCEGLAASHEKGIVHRDIKSENIILTPKGQAKIMDFGLAKVKGATRLTKTGSTLGTAAYMSPEQAQGEEVDGRSDIFSFGVVLYELLTGRLPFRGEHPAALAYSILNESPQPVARFNEKVTPEIEYLVGKALAKDREDRYQHVDDLLADLRREKRNLEYAQAGHTISGAGTTNRFTAKSENTSHTKRERMIFAGVGTGLFFGIMVLIFFLFSKGKNWINPDWRPYPLPIPFKEIGYPGLSGDGNWLTFGAKDESGKWALYLMNVRQGGPRQVTTIATSFAPAADVSADGGLLLYTTLEGQPPELDCYTIYSTGGAPRRIVRGGFAPRFRLDGLRVGYIIGVDVTAPSPSGKREFWSVGTDGRDPHREFVDSAVQVVGRFSFAYAPDGKKIAWLRSFPMFYEEIVVYNLETGEERQITSDKSRIDEVAWVEGDKILYTTEKSGIFNLWLVPAGGGTPVQVTKGTEPVLGIKVSSDGRNLVYQQSREPADFWIVDIAENRSRQITLTDENNYSPAFSPDGKEIAFAAGDFVGYGPHATVPTHLYIIDKDGRNRRQLTFGDEVIWRVKWSPDGKRIAYGARKPSEPVDSFRTFVTEPAIPGYGKDLGVGIPAQNWLNTTTVQVATNDGVYLASIDGAARTKVTDDSTYATFIQGGKYILSQHYGRGKDHRIYLLDGGRKPKERRNTGRLLPWPSLDNVVVSGDGRTIFSWVASGTVTRMAAPDGKEERIPADFLGVYFIDDMSPSWDGKEMIIIKHRKESKIVMIENLFK